MIELLVVIAIIGILSSVVLASLGIARGKGADAKVKSQLSSARNSAEIYRDTHGYFNDTVTVGGDIAWDCTTPDSMFQDGPSGMSQYTDPNNYPNNTVPDLIRCSATANEYSISVAMTSNTGGVDPDFWCVDNTGQSKLVEAVDHATAHPDGDTTCN